MATNDRHDGYFDPRGMVWRISREQALMLGGARALLMQVAHPLTAAGVVAHSGYRENPWRRLERTMTSVWTAVYGTRAEADRAGARVRSIHRKVRGRIATPLGPFPAGTIYSAEDANLLLWVHATLVDTALLVYETWVGALREEEKRSYYDEMKTLAELFGTPRAVIPETLDDFRHYMHERLTSDEICVTEPAQEVLASITGPPLPRPLRPAWRAVTLVTAGLLPVKLRDQYGFRWDLPRRALYAGSREYMRRLILPLLPDLVRANGPARRAERAAGANGALRLAA